jgi:hypothetical protein
MSMNQLEKAAWSTLSASTQQTILASQQAVDPSTVDLGPERHVSIGEVPIWVKHQTHVFTARVLKSLNPGASSLANLLRGAFIHSMMRGER